MVFHAFRAISHVIDAIMASSIYSTRRPSIIILELSKDNNPVPESETNSQDRNDCIEILKLLAAAKDELQKIQPFKFQVEVLENIFSLLFLTRDNIQPEAIPGFEGTIQDVEHGYGSTTAQSCFEREDGLLPTPFSSPWALLRSKSESENVCKYHFFKLMIW